MEIERIPDDEVDALFSEEYGRGFSGELRKAFKHAAIGDVFMIRKKEGESDKKIKNRVGGTCAQIKAVISYRKHKDGLVVKFLGWRDE